MWTETQSLDVNDGVFHVYLGAVEPLDTVAFNQPIDLGIKLDGEPSEISPRTPLAAAAFALGMRGLYIVSAMKRGDLDSAPNLIAGAENNFLAEDVIGATIGGGGGFWSAGSFPNSVLKDWGTVSGGRGNAAGYIASVGGGLGNVAWGTLSTVGGGRENTAGSAATIGGGEVNTADEWGTVSGGYENTANGRAATVVGGQANTASGSWSTVGGGQENAAIGDYSFAAGRKARADHHGTFIWADTTDAELSSTADAFASLPPLASLARGTRRLQISESYVLLSKLVARLTEGFEGLCPAYKVGSVRPVTNARSSSVRQSPDVRSDTFETVEKDPSYLWEG